MIPIKRLKLIKNTTDVLKKRADGAHQLTPGSPQIESRWAYFIRSDSKVPTVNRDAIADVRLKLVEMYKGKCCYCENIVSSNMQDIEHFYPKTFYPKKMFQWINFLRACKQCNFEKLDADPKKPKDPNGDRSLLDPTQDRPEDFLSWDMLTGKPVVVRPNGPNHRGQRTIKVCGLDNETYNEQRRKRADWVRMLLLDVANTTPVPPTAVSLLSDMIEIKAPWLGIIRQMVLDPAMAQLIQDVEARAPRLSPHFAALRWTHP